MALESILYMTILVLENAINIQLPVSTYTSNLHIFIC